MSPVKSAWANELIDGVTARYYMPDNTLTVAQAVKLAAALHQKQSVGFVTLQNGGIHWYDNYVNYAVANSLIEAAYQSKSAEMMNAPVSQRGICPHPREAPERRDDQHGQQHPGCESGRRLRG